MTQVQVIKCKCGAAFAGCRVPECYEEADWMRDIRKYVKQGCTVEVLNSDQFKDQFGAKCTCKEKEENRDGETKDINQLELFEQ